MINNLGGFHLFMSLKKPVVIVFILFIFIFVMTTQSVATGETNVDGDCLNQGEGAFIEVLVQLEKKAETENFADITRQSLTKEKAAEQVRVEIRSAVVNSLQETAQNSQTPIIEFLEEQMMLGQVDDYRSYYIVNLLFVRGSEEAVKKLAKFPEVERVLPNEKISLVEPIEESEPSPSQAESQSINVEWNIDRVGAPMVWHQYGVDGSGVVIGIIDSEWTGSMLRLNNSTVAIVRTNQEILVIVITGMIPML